MYDDAQDALAAEYVLGTLSADEREHAEALLTLDPGFAASVRMWERRLGELNVMVEAVEPSAEMIKQRTPTAARCIRATAERLPLCDQSFRLRLQLFQLGLNLFQSRHYGFLKSISNPCRARRWRRNADEVYR